MSRISLLQIAPLILCAYFIEIFSLLSPASHVKRLIMPILCTASQNLCDPNHADYNGLRTSQHARPQSVIGDIGLALGEVFLMRLPFDMSEESTDPSTWTTSSGPSPPPHPCILIKYMLSGSMIKLGIFILRSFRGRNPREITERSSNEFLLLPFPSEEPAETPAAFGEPLPAPTLRTRAQTWLLIHPAESTLKAGTKLIRTSTYPAD